MTFEQNRFIVNPKEIRRHPNISPFLQATQHFIDVFNCFFEIIEFRLRPLLTDDQLIMFIDWLNGVKNEIREIIILSAMSSLFEVFRNRFRKSINTLTLLDTDFSDSESSNSPLDFLFNINIERIISHNPNLSAEDLNLFLRSWQEGKTNLNLKQVKFIFWEGKDVKEVLKDCGGELMDPRETKIKFRERYDIWYRGGIHIRRNDGRLAVIDTSGHEYWKEDEIYEEHALKYLEDHEIWNSENSPWYETMFVIHFL
uniref:FBA_2 domain-containing protein n=3 Tax=Caenorhabditis tropicalis TaxID=1561998 RepID=A0A1I7U1D6_9PELO